jgi:hypothetical protein
MKHRRRPSSIIRMENLFSVCLMKRRRRPSNNIRMENLFSIASSDSDSESSL